jgi:hypothetical protein
LTKVYSFDSRVDTFEMPVQNIKSNNMTKKKLIELILRFLETDEDNLRQAFGGMGRRERKKRMLSCNGIDTKSWSINPKGVLL